MKNFRRVFHGYVDKSVEDLEASLTDSDGLIMNYCFATKTECVACGCDPRKVKITVMVEKE